ncbi:hypothetical protein JCM11491_006382 [Sporobolomyces phaffii]
MAMLDQLRDQLAAANDFAIALSSILLWDYLSLLPKEIRHIWRADKTTPFHVVFYLNRYGTLLLQAMYLTLLFAPVSKDRPLSSIEHPSTLHSAEMDLDHIKFQFSAEVQTCIAFTAILLWDWLSMFPSEFKYIWRATTINPTRIVFLLNRYGTLVLQTTSMALIVATVSEETCSKVFWIESLGFIYVVFTSDVLLALRVSALWGNSRKVIFALLSMLVAELTLLTAVGTQLRPVVLPPPVAEYIGLTGCLTGDYHGNQPGLIYVNTIAPFLVNLTLLGMTFHRSWQVTKDLGVKLPILRRLTYDGAQYFAMISAANLVQVCFWSQSDKTIKSFGVPALIVISSTLSCRLVLSLFTAKPLTSALSSLPAFHQPPSATTAQVRISRAPTAPDPETSTFPVVLRLDSLSNGRPCEPDEEKELEGKRSS